MAALSGLIRELAISDNADPYTRLGMPDPAKQVLSLEGGACK